MGIPDVCNAVSAGFSEPDVPVLVAEGEAIFRTGLAGIVGTLDGFNVVAQAACGATAARALRGKMPRLALVDLEIARAVADLGGLTKETKVVVLAQNPGLGTLEEALALGALGCVGKTLDGALLEAVMRHVMVGGVAVASALANGLMGGEAAVSQPQFTAVHQRVGLLNDSERQVLQLLGHGMENAEIAKALHLSRASVKTYVSRLLGKLHLGNRTQAALLANETGLVSGAGVPL